MRNGYASLNGIGKTTLKILEMHLKKGYAKILPQSLDDLWHLYNVIYPGDRVYAKTTREVKIQEEYARPKQGRRVTVLLGLQVERVLWDRSLNRLRVHGTISDVPEAIGGIGSHHTLNIVVDQPLTIVKAKWLKHQVDRLEKASHVETPLVVLVSIDDEELAVAVLRQYGLEVKVEKRIRLPGKLEAEKRDEALKGYFKEALNLLRETWASLNCPIVILGLGFVKNGFAKYVKDAAPDVAAAVADVKSVNSSGVTGINEAVRSGVLTKTLKHARMAEETQLVEEVLARLGKGTRDVAYGLDEVVKATQYGAVEKLLLTDTMLRESTDEKRTELEKIMREAEEKAGQITVVSTEHEGGTKLHGLGGIAALLRFQIS
jgi:protein pelota